MPDSASPSDLRLGRRSLLASTAALAGGILWPQHAAGDGPDAAADKWSTIRIRALRAMPVGGKVYVKIDTNHDISGWGEITGLEPKVAALLAESLFELLDGENPTRIEHLWQKIYRSHRDMRGGPFMVHTLSAIDMALWDITGRVHGVPVYRLLGGPVRDRIRLYPNAKAFKQAAGGPYPHAATAKEVAALVERVAQARKRVGPDGTVMFDAHCCLPPATLIQFAQAIEPYEVLWIEEPAVPGNIEVFKRIREHIKIPLATGERDRTIWEVIPYLEHRVIDILQPDCGHCGGITQVKKMATLAEAYHVPIAPHSTMSALGLTASLHAVASVPLFLIHEAYLDGHIMPDAVARRSWEVDANGNAVLNDAPGLGVDMDEKLIADLVANPKKIYKWPQPKLKDGSTADY